MWTWVLSIFLEAYKNPKSKTAALAIIIAAALVGTYLADLRLQAREHTQLEARQDTELQRINSAIKALPKMQRSLIRIEKALGIPPEENYYSRVEE